VKLAFEKGKKAERVREVFFVAVDVLVSCTCTCFCMLFETNVAKDKQEFHSFALDVSFMQSVLFERCDARRKNNRDTCKGQETKAKPITNVMAVRHLVSLSRLVRPESLATD